MAKTAWSVAPRPRTEWVMTDGTIHQSPLIETTPSRRRWRVQGTDVSVQQYDLNNQIVEYMRGIGRASNTAPWFQISDEQDELRKHSAKAYGGYGIDWSETPEVKLGKPHKMPIAFEFKHQSLPVRAILWVILSINGNGSSATVGTGVTHRILDPGTPSDDSVTNWTDLTSTLPFPLEVKRFSNPRAAASHFLNLTQLALEVDSFHLPDPRDPHTSLAQGLEFHFTRTNYTVDFYREVLDIVQSAPAMERLAAHLAGIRRELSTLGLVVHEDTGNLQSLLNGNLDLLSVHLIPQESEDSADGGQDKHHNVYLDLAHGIFTVRCGYHDLAESLDAWTVAKFKAEVSGETDTLAAFIKAHNHRADIARLRKIINERKVELPKPI